MSEQVRYVQLKDLDDMVRFVAFSPTPFLQHIEIKGKHIYFIQAIFRRGVILYYIERREKIPEKYIVFHRLSGKITFSDVVSTDANLSHIPILEVHRQNVFTEDMFE